LNLLHQTPKKPICAKYIEKFAKNLVQNGRDFENGVEYVNSSPVSAIWLIIELIY
jgi:hypothetical protein